MGGLARLGRRLHYISGVMSNRNTDGYNNWVLELDDISSRWKNVAPLWDGAGIFMVLSLRGCRTTPPQWTRQGTAFARRESGTPLSA